jgi:predicted nucleic acid-binding protein
MMPRTITLDTSVLVTATLLHEEHHEQARVLLAQLNREDITIAVPALLIPEFASALKRNGRASARVREYLRVFRSQQSEVWPLDGALADMAAEIALTQALKGSDSVFLALARLLGVPLITLDREQRERAPADIEVFSPDEALAKWWPE